MKEETTKKCRVCLERKHLSQMKTRKEGAYGVDTICKSCAREKEFFRVHGVERPKDLSLVFKLIAGVKHKRCPTCFEYKTYDNFCGANTLLEGVGTYCFVCARERNRQYHLKNGERVRQLSRDWVKNNYEKNRLQDKLRGERYRNSDKYKITRERFRKNNPEKIELNRRKNRLRSKLDVANISERYARSTLGSGSPMKGSEFPQEFVKAYQELMKIRRFIKENKI
jgi:hypothetical protein